MTKINDNLYLCIGIITAAHGIKGEVKITSYARDPERFCSYKTLIREDTTLLQLKSKVLDHNKILSKIETINTRNDAEKLIGTKLFIERNKLEELHSEEYYHSDLIDMQVLSVNQEELGVVKGIHNFGAGDVIEILMLASGTAEFFPFTKDVILDINLKKGYIIMQPPEYI